MKKLKIYVIFGTRPELIKLYPLIVELKKWANVKILHTGQHYSKNLWDSNLGVFKLKIDHQIRSQAKNQFTSISKMICGISKILEEDRPEAVVVHGDTNSTLAGSLVAARLKIQLVHIEAGARCHDKRVPEEQNRIITDHLSNLNFAYDNESMANLSSEGLQKNSRKESNTAYGAVDFAENILRHSKSGKEAGYDLICTIHRAENTDNPATLRSIIQVLNAISAKYSILFPLHPRTKNKIKSYNIKLAKEVTLCPPKDYLSFLSELRKAKMVISDSGGVVDECIYYGKPLMVVREKTERNDFVKKGLIQQVSPADLKKNEHKIIELIRSAERDNSSEFDVESSKKISNEIETFFSRK